MTYLAASIGIPKKADAQQLSRTLVERRIAAGTRIVRGISHYRWDGDVHEREYWTVTAFTTRDQVDLIEALVHEYTDDDLPGITYTEIDASDAYLEWIETQTE